MQLTHPDSPVRVLLVEDSPGDARLVREYLSAAGSSGFEITCVDRLRSALEHLGARPFDAVLLDLSLPDSSAPDTLPAVRAKAADVPIVVLTGLEDEAAGLDAVRHGVQDFLVKGHIDANTLSRSIRYAIMRNRLESALTERTAQLEEAVRLKDLFTDIIRHDLVEVLNIIKGAIERVVDNPADGEQRESMLLMAQRNVDRLDEILCTASLYARLEKVEDFQRQQLDLGGLLRAAIENLKPALEAKHMRLECLATGAYPAEVNQLVESVFVNLLSNAIKYSPEGQRIEVDMADCSDRYRVSVKDWGEGIADEDKAKLFTRFQRVHKKGVKGTGLGLAIAKRIVDLHGGRIWIEDNPQGGSIFYVELSKP
jgi:two-component system cell cycle response regulator